MKKTALLVSMSTALLLAAPVQAEPASMNDLSFRQENPARPAQVSRATSEDAITRYRPYHLRSNAVTADTEIAAFEEVSGKPASTRIKRMDRSI